MSRVESTVAGGRPPAASQGTESGLAVRVCADELPGNRPSERDEDAALDQEGLGEEDPFSDVLDTGRNEGIADTDDAIASDLDIGMLLEDTPDGPNEADVDELVLDIGELLNATDDRDLRDAGEEDGPAAPEAFYGIEELPLEGGWGAAEGLPEPATDLSEQPLPDLDGDVDDETVELVDVASVGDPACDEALPDWAASPWDARAAEPALPPSAVLVLAGDWVVAGASELWWLDRGCSVKHRVAGPGDSIVALAPGTAGATAAVVLATSSGDMSRATPERCSSAGLESWRRVAGVRAHEPLSLELCSSASDPSTVLARTSSGRLLRSVNGGLGWSSVELHGRVLAISPTASPALALLECRGRHQLVRSDDGGNNWRVLEPDQILETVIVEQGILLAAAEDVMAVAGATSGVAICTDGVRFHHIAGCSGATALTAASVNGRACVGVAVYRELEQCSYLVAVDASGRHALRIAEVRAPSSTDEDPDGMPDYARVSALAWDATGRLWAAGGFGVMSWALCAAAVATS
ncbi:MAG: hypothetical protein JW940_24270 [Polyangiaceae bacterium]|nr:hypothetical protein [Polyangiaceae bacterium]